MITHITGCSYTGSSFYPTDTVCHFPLTHVNTEALEH